MNDMHSKIKNNIKVAMRDKDIVKKDCLKNVLGKAQELAKDMKYDTDDIPDDILLDAVRKEVKQLNQTINSLSDCQDVDLYMVSEQQLNILKDYLPKQMNQKEVEEAVAWILGDNPPADFGKRMKYVMKELRDKADSKLIRKVVENYK